MSDDAAIVAAAVELDQRRRAHNVAAQHAEAARAQLIAAARDAHAAGVPPSLLAETAGVTTMTIWRWLRKEPH